MIDIRAKILGTDKRFPNEIYEVDVTWTDDGSLSLVEEEGDVFNWIYLCPEQVTKLYELLQSRLG